MRDDPVVIALVQRARDGDQFAWNELVDRFAPLVWAVCQRYRLSGAAADDVAATVWLRLVERLGSIREPAALPGWIATTTSRECLQALRAASRQVLTDDLELAGAVEESFDEWLFEQERQIALRTALTELDERCRRLLELLFTEPPVPYADIASRMSMTIGSIGPTRMRCLDKLRAAPPIVALRESAGGERHDQRMG